MKILFTGGGTGGHVFPLVAITRELNRMTSEDNLNLFYVGPKDEFAEILLRQEDVKIYNIPGGKIRRYFSFETFIDIFYKLPIDFIKSFYFLLKIKPNLIFSKGGTGSLAICYCAKFFKIPIFLHESDVAPGLSNRIISQWAKKIFISFPKTEFFDLEKTILTGNPIRKELLDGDIEKAKELFNLTLEKPIILFWGASLGAEFINDFVLRILNELLEKFEIIHITGKENLKEVENESLIVINKDLKKYYHIYGFLDEEKLKAVFSACDFVISRSGASSIFEIAGSGKPSILVPLPSAAFNHQAKNAYAYADTGASLVIEQSNLTPNFFLDKINYFFSHPEKLEQMKTEALRFSKPLAAKSVAREIIEFLTF
jgi:UDP-N-acetylglucosamine--N-acetylmuramyl-(pentapeptide) pyrophosphoryl-undecaprenol N-acetylglucosamine transferase